MRDRIALALIFLWTVLLVAAADARAEKRVALVIGNGAYRDVSFLKKPPNDARKVAAILKDMGFDVTLSIDADKQELERLAADFKAALPSADVGFFFFSGHGFQTANVSQQHPINHIVPIDFDVEKATSELGTVSLDVIVEALRSNARLGYVFMDACRNDPRLTEASQRQGEASRAVQITRGFSAISPKLPEASKLPRDNGPAGLLIAYSTDPGNVAFEGPTGDLSPFTSALARHLTTRGLSIAEILGLVSADVARETGGRQTPWNVASLTAGAYRFLAAPPAAQQSAPRPASFSGNSSSGNSRPSSGAGSRPSGGGGAPARSNNLPPNIGVGAGAGL